MSSARGVSLKPTIGSVIGTHFHKREPLSGHFGGYFTFPASHKPRGLHLRDRSHGAHDQPVGIGLSAAAKATPTFLKPSRTWASRDGRSIPLKLAPKLRSSALRGPICCRTPVGVSGMTHLEAMAVRSRIALVDIEINHGAISWRRSVSRGSSFSASGRSMSNLSLQMMPETFSEEETYQPVHVSRRQRHRPDLWINPQLRSAADTKKRE